MKHTPWNGEDVASSQMIIEAIEGIAYIVDRNGAIVAIGGENWDKFASDNGALDIFSNSLIGRNLFDFVVGSTVRDSYKRFSSALFSGQRSTISFVYRCDSPSVRRDMRLCMSPIKSGDEVVGLLYQSLIVSEQERPQINLFNTARLTDLVGLPEDAPTVALCSYCHNVMREGADENCAEDWQTPETYYKFGGRSHVLISHGICPSCYERLVMPLLNGDNADEGTNSETQN